MILLLQKQKRQDKTRQDKRDEGYSPSGLTLGARSRIWYGMSILSRRMPIIRPAIPAPTMIIFGRGLGERVIIKCVTSNRAEERKGLKKRKGRKKEWEERKEENRSSFPERTKEGRGRSWPMKWMRIMTFPSKSPFLCTRGTNKQKDERSSWLHCEPFSSIFFVVPQLYTILSHVKRWANRRVM